jgi:hypothetical protein
MKMPISLENARALLQSMKLQELFLTQLNWNRPQSREFQVTVHAGDYRLTPIAEQGGLQALTVRALNGTGIPDRATRLAIDTKATAHVYEHLLIFLEPSNTTTVWTWAKRENGKRVASFDHRFNVQQSGDSLVAKLAGLAFDLSELDDQGQATLRTVLQRVESSLKVDRVTKRFYDDFQSRHTSFLAFIDGIDALDDRRWYASVMLNRLMFIYFIQKQGFLDGDVNYLRTRLQRCQREGLPYYRGFLVHLFFEGFAARPEERAPETNDLLGSVPYLNGGLFLPHQLEEANGGIDIPDAAFEQVFEFFERYQWHLDDRPLHDDNEINPDVLGYIFEKYINQKQMGAYYTKEDITGYIARNTVLPFLFDRLKHFCYDAITPLPIGCADARTCPAETQTAEAIDRYIYDAVKKGVDLELPEYIAAGLDDVSQRTRWNERADEAFANPTETWREHVARRRRYEQIVADFLAGKIADINDFITYNLDIVQYAQDFLADTQDPRVIQTFYFECLTQVTILDPTCGSGAFLFAALNLLEPLYELCLERMEDFLARKKRHPEWAQTFEQELARVEEHPSRPYFIYKSIIVNNLFGVDIMDEAVEIAKLRLFLKLVAQVEDVDHIEPLPDIDFNIRAGNTLVGYATLEEIERAKGPGTKGTASFDFGGIVDRVKAVDRHIKDFRTAQTALGLKSQDFRETKANLQTALRAVEDELNRDLAFEYGRSEDLPEFLRTHRPFHWYVEFNDIMQHGGFDIIIGNPPFVEYAKVESEYAVNDGCFATVTTGNLYPLVVERSTRLLTKDGRFGMILPLSAFCTRRMAPLLGLLRDSGMGLWISHFCWRPAKLFEGVNIPLSILLASGAGEGLMTTALTKWYGEQRSALLPSLAYVPGEFHSSLSWVVPKFGSRLAVDIIHKMCRDSSTVGDYCTTLQKGHKSLYYRNTGGLYWRIVTDFRPFFSQNGLKMKSSTEAELCFQDKDVSALALALLNSNLFWLWYDIFSSFHHVNPWDLMDLPLSVDRMSHELQDSLARASGKLMEDLGSHSVRRQRAHKGGKTSVVQTFYPWRSKPIIDQIDRLLAAHYGFTDEELDFIINYDIKYRMGGADNGD